MQPNEYQRLTEQTEIYSKASIAFTRNLMSAHDAQDYLKIGQCVNFLSIMYCTGKLSGEAGEIDELVFKAFRGDVGTITEELRQKLLKELGDVQWYIARIADLVGFTLEEVMQTNIDKLLDRKNRGVLHGYGDER